MENKNVLDDILNITKRDRDYNENNSRFNRLIVVLFRTFFEVNKAIGDVDADYGITLLLNEVLQLNIEFHPSYYKELKNVIFSYQIPKANA